MMDVFVVIYEYEDYGFNHKAIHSIYSEQKPADDTAKKMNKNIYVNNIDIDNPKAWVEVWNVHGSE